MRTIKEIKRNILRTLFPKTYLKKIYKTKTGKTLNLKAPSTFNEKIQWLKLYELPHNQSIIEAADKANLPKILISKGLSKYAAPIIGSWAKFEDIPLNELPDQFVLKLNNASGVNIFITDKANTNWKDVNNYFSHWIKRDYGLLNLERHYSKIAPQIVAESYLDLSDDLLEYNFHCFHGKVKFCNAIRFENKFTKKQKATSYSETWNKLDLYKTTENLPFSVPKPENLLELIHICETLSQNFIFVRVDFFKCKNNLILGELTFSPSAGYSRSYNDSAQTLMGSWIDLSKSQFYIK